MAEGKRQPPSPPEQEQHSTSPPEQEQHSLLSPNVQESSVSSVSVGHVDMGLSMSESESEESVHLGVDLGVSVSVGHVDMGLDLDSLMPRDIDASEQSKSKEREDKKSIEDIEQEDMSKSERKEDTSFLHARIPGVEIIAEKSVQVTNEEQNIIWDGYGLRVHIPRGSLPKGRSHCQLKIGVAVSGEFQLPENGIPTSAVYWLSHDLQEELQNPITLEMQHCAANSALNGLCVARASTLSYNLPYKFEQIQGAVFTPNTCYGAIKLRNFSLFTTYLLRALRAFQPHFFRPIEYCAILYYTNVVNMSFKSHVYILQNLDSHFRAIEAKLDQPFIKGPDSKIEFESEEISLDIPVDRVTITDNWKITPLNALVVRKEDIDRFSFRRRLPVHSCQMSVSWSGEERKKIIPLNYKITLKGAKDKYNFLTLTSDCLPLGSGVRLSSQEGATASFINDGGAPSQSLLMNEVASRVSVKWEDIATMLALRPPEIQRISTECGSNTHSCIRAVFNIWETSDSKPYTWKTIVEVLGSDLVNERKLAREIKQKFCMDIR